MSGCICISSERNPIQSIVLSVVLNYALPVDMSTKSQYYFITSPLHSKIPLCNPHNNYPVTHWKFWNDILPGVLKCWMEMIWAARAW
eukprot:scaffold7802_cov115-Skeletonema_dohrnii-CCMP3373.AAC.2